MSALPPNTDLASDTKRAVATPAMAQFLEVKAANPDCLIFFRMGDFYELFFKDAEVASAVLGIALTKRGKHKEQDIPMAGVPVHAAQDYLNKLIQAGHKVAVCEQMEDPAEAKKRGSKAVVRREVRRLVTPGTLTEDALLPTAGANWLLAVIPDGNGSALALAWVDLSTGAFEVETIPADRLDAELARLSPAETIFPDSLTEENPARRSITSRGGAVSQLPAALFHGGTAEKKVAAAFGVGTPAAFGDFTRLQLRAAAGIIGYIERTQKQSFGALSPPIKRTSGAFLAMDEATRESLDIIKTSSATGQSLLKAINRCVSNAGTRKLAEFLSAPSTELSVMTQRHAAVSWFMENGDMREALRNDLSSAPDLARLISRVSLNRAGPRDLASIGACLSAALSMVSTLSVTNVARVDACFKTLAGSPKGLQERLTRELTENLPLFARDGGFIASGVNADLDHARQLRDDARKVIIGLQKSYSEKTGARSLKIKHNGVLGYFIEVPAAQADQIQAEPELYFHRQTMASAMRYSTKELAELEAQISNAATRALAIEQALFDSLCEEVDHHLKTLTNIASALAEIDVLCGLAETASHENWVRPKMTEDSCFEVTGGRHPVVEKALRSEGEATFVANDCALGSPGDREGRVHLVTGPNMGGKSTFLRQNALLVVLAQAGSFVPAQGARMGIVDALFSRVGAADDLAKGRSTFMVEMVETAAILNRAGPKSLVILDEIGRGTATYDGLSIAWAAVEHLHEACRSRALFATHYHELTVLAEKLDRVDNRTLKVREWDGEVIFMHEVAPGAADRSYGIQVAKLAGLPSQVIERARSVLAHLESRGDGSVQNDDLFEGLPLFAAKQPPTDRTAPSEELIEAKAKEQLGKLLSGHDPDAMSPRQALEVLYHLRNYANSD
ncbi:MAG: DNA mismatch repair protein MutS [Pseudomonadota bacterium]